MNSISRKVWSLLIVVAAYSFVSISFAQYAVEVLSYDQGTTATQVFNPDPNAPPEFFNMDLASLGSPERFTGEGVFPGAVTPFNPAFLTNEIVSVGESGHLSLRLSNFVIPQAGGPEIGVFANTGLIDVDFPNGQAGSPATAFGVDSADVDVSEDGINWVALGNMVFDIPASGYNDIAQTVPSDFQKPFVGPFSSFDGLALEDPNSPDILELLDGSGGGKWLDISGSGLSQVGYIRFRVDDDGNSGIELNFELDAVSIASNAMGTATVPEPSTVLYLAIAGLLTAYTDRNSRKNRV